MKGSVLLIITFSVTTSSLNSGQSLHLVLINIDEKE